MHRAAFVIAASLLAATALAAADPAMLGRFEDGSTLYLASSDGAGNLRLVRTRRVYPAPRQVGQFSGVLSEIAWQRIDCITRTHETERMEWYDNPDASGRPLQEFDVPAALRQTLVVRADDRSVAGALVNAACAGGGTVLAGQPTAPARPQPWAPARPGAPAWPGTPAGPGAFPPPGSTPADPAAPPLGGLGENRGAPPAPRGPDGGMPPTGRSPAPPKPPQAPPEPGGTIADQRPFPESVFTLGTMGRLAQYVYFDQEQLALLSAAADTMARAQARLVPGSVMKSLVETAAARNDKALGRYRAALAAKEAMLASESLVSEPLPALPVKPIAAFRAELYRHVPSGQLILVFRGSQEGLDWLSNVWLGVDLFSIESPHYQAARELTERIVRSGKKPLVVGHSLGGGMAQYVGQLHGLKTVAFNSSPLPARYIPARHDKAPDNIKLFSAIEFYDQPNNTVTRADPVSLRLPKLAEDLSAWFGTAPDDGLVKAHQHLVAPVCVASRPQPFRNEEEDEDLGRRINHMLYPSVMGYVLTGQPMKGAIEQGMQVWISKEVGRQLSDPVWQPASRSAFDKRVSEYAKKEVASAAIDAFHAAQGAAKMGNVLYNSAVGSMWKAVSTMGKAAGKTMFKVELGLQFMPHSMERFNRGMLAEVGSDVFVARSITAQCRPPAATY
jgi:hypothetical protein